MTDKKPLWATTPSVPAADEIARAWRRVFRSAIDAMLAGSERASAAPRPLPYDPLAPARAFSEFALSLMSDPVALMSAQMRAMQDWTSLAMTQGARAAGEAGDPAIAPAKGDRRFADPAWSDDIFFDTLKQSYLLAARQTLDLVADARGLDDRTRARVDFFVRQYLYALSPANFAATNPEAIRRAMETSGLNLLGGLANFLADYADEGAWIARRAGAGFEIGKDLAATEGAVVYQNDLMQLIQYAPATDKVYKRPLVYAPPLVNKYYLMDLTPKASLFKWLVDQGHTVFAISWINPGPELSGKDFADYVLEGPVAAIAKAKEAAGAEAVDLFSFCMGGALAAAALAYLAQTGKAGDVASATMIGAMVDYGDLGEWSTFTEPAQVDAFHAHLDAAGGVGGGELKKLFSVVRANDLIWNSVVDHYLMDRAAPPSDLLHWFADGANMTGAFLKTWSRDILQENKLAKGAMKIGDAALDLSMVKTPVLNLALKEDHVSAWRAVYRNRDYFGGDVTFVLGGSGHNAGVVNPPSRGKHGFWVNGAGAPSAESWLAAAEKREGSWWPEWQAWLTSGANAQEKVPARKIGEILPAIEPAPGSYVRG